MKRTVAGLILLSWLSLEPGCTPDKNMHRTAFFGLMESALQNYAHDHAGYFPDEGDPFKSLQELYPDYSGTGVELAGLSGNIATVTNALQNGMSISNLTSWMYVAGLHTNDNPRLAILWESRPGIGRNGVFVGDGGRPVLLLDGDVVVIAAKDWLSFQQEQRLMRRSANRTQPRQVSQEAGSEHPTDE